MGRRVTWGARLPDRGTRRADENTGGGADQVSGQTGRAAERARSVQQAERTGHHVQGYGQEQQRHHLRRRAQASLVLPCHKCQVRGIAEAGGPRAAAGSVRPVLVGASTDDGKFGNWEPVRTQVLHIMQEQDANAPTEEDGDVKKQTQFLETVYNVIDLDGDGALTKLELQAACNAATAHLITGQDLFGRLLDFIAKQILASLQSLPEPEAPASTDEAPASTCEAPASTGEASLSITQLQWVTFWLTQVETYKWGPVKSDVRKLQLSQMQVHCGKEFVKGAGAVQAAFEAQQYKNGEAVFEKIDKNNDGKLSLEEVKAWAEDKDNTKEAQKFFYRWVETDGEQVRETDGQHFFAELQQCVFKCGAGTNYSSESTDPALLKRALTEGGTNYEMTKTVFATKYASVIKTRAGKNQKQFTSALIKA